MCVSTICTTCTRLSDVQRWNHFLRLQHSSSWSDPRAVAWGQRTALLFLPPYNCIKDAQPTLINISICCHESKVRLEYECLCAAWLCSFNVSHPDNQVQKVNFSMCTTDSSAGLFNELMQESSFLPELTDFSEGKTASEGMLWMDDRGSSLSVLVSQVDSVSLVQLSKYRGSRASVLLPPQPIALHRGAFTSWPGRWQLQISVPTQKKT